MARLVINNNITSGGCLDSGQTLQFGGFTIRAHVVVDGGTPPMAAGHCPRIGPKYSKKLDSADVLSLNELLDRIATLGVSMNYDRIRLKPDEREINHPPITHFVAVVQELATYTFLPILKTKYVQVPESLESDTSPSDGTLRPPDSGSSVGLPEPLCLTGPEPDTSEAILAPNTDVGQDPKFNPSTHHNLYSPSNSGPPDIYDLIYVW